MVEESIFVFDNTSSTADAVPLPLKGKAWLCEYMTYTWVVEDVDPNDAGVFFVGQSGTPVPTVGL